MHRAPEALKLKLLFIPTSGGQLLQQPCAACWNCGRQSKHFLLTNSGWQLHGCSEKEPNSRASHRWAPVSVWLTLLDLASVKSLFYCWLVTFSGAESQVEERPSPLHTVPVPKGAREMVKNHLPRRPPSRQTEADSWTILLSWSLHLHSASIPAPSQARTSNTSLQTNLAVSQDKLAFLRHSYSVHGSTWLKCVRNSTLHLPLHLHLCASFSSLQRENTGEKKRSGWQGECQ